ncbi:hypothetical protein EYC84_000168 [Monilinia fructicola]|uniref:Uncharacterized protein n=1 Tax=Monilinia fructicola TaxID=38448 RepID=A0A5M9JMQ8_MONFR|nr:hypothetical protein EYC84_000168 [Monilinia fructicola]
MLMGCRSVLGFTLFSCVKSDLFIVVLGSQDHLSILLYALDNTITANVIPFPDRRYRSHPSKWQALWSLQRKDRLSGLSGDVEISGVISPGILGAAHWPLLELLDLSIPSQVALSANRPIIVFNSTQITSKLILNQHTRFCLKKSHTTSQGVKEWGSFWRQTTR